MKCNSGLLIRVDWESRQYPRIAVAGTGGLKKK